MTPPAPLGDDWLYWDPHAMEAYPHSVDACEEDRGAEQLELFESTEACACRSEPARE